MSELANQLTERATATVVTRTPEQTIREVIERQKFEIGRALPTGMNAERFTRLVVTQTRQTPKLVECTTASLLGAVMTAAQLGLEPGPLQHCYLIPRRNRGRWEVQFMLGYRGIVDLSLRGGRTKSVDAHVVREGDEFDFEFGTAPFLRHRPRMNGERGDVIAAYAVAALKDGGAPFVVLDLNEIAARRARSAAGDSGPWATDYAAMCRKTAVRALAPLIPQTPEFAVAQQVDETVLNDFTPLEERERIEVDLDADYDDAEIVDTADPTEPDPFAAAIIVQARAEVSALKGKAKNDFSAWAKAEGLDARDWNEADASRVVEWLHQPAEDAT